MLSSILKDAAVEHSKRCCRAYIIKSSPKKVNILAPELFVLNFALFWTSLEALSLRCHPTLRGGNKGLTLKNNFLHVQKIRTHNLKISSQKMTIPPPHMEGGRHHGVMTPWCHDTMVSWHHGVMTPWFPRKNKHSGPGTFDSKFITFCHAFGHHSDRHASIWEMGTSFRHRISTQICIEAPLSP